MPSDGCTFLVANGFTLLLDPNQRAGEHLASVTNLTEIPANSLIFQRPRTARTERAFLCRFSHFRTFDPPMIRNV